MKTLELNQFQNISAGNAWPGSIDAGEWKLLKADWAAYKHACQYGYPSEQDAAWAKYSKDLKEAMSD
jgi:hypothetical protein